MDISQKKIAKILSLLSKEEVGLFKDWLLSPYFVKPELQQINLALLELLLRAIDQEKSFEAVEAEISQKIFDGAPMAKGRVAKLFSQLGKFVYQFWASEKSKSSYQGGIEVARILRKRNATDLWDSQFKKISKEILKAGRTFDNAFYWEALQLDLEELAARRRATRSSIAPNVKVIMNRLNELYIHNGLYLGIQAFNVDRFIVSFGLEKELNVLNELISDIDHADINPGQFFMIKLYRLLLNAEELGVQDVSPLIAESLNLRQEYTKSMYTAMRGIIRNFLIHFYNKGDYTLEGEILKMYQDDFENSSLFYDSKIHVAAVNNISTFAIRQKEYSWLASFLTNVSTSILEENHQEFAIALNRAKLSFAKGEFENALDLLDFDVKDFYSKMNVRLIEIMALYELKSAQLDSKIDSHKIFIHRIPKSKVVQKFIEGHNNFILILININNPQNALSLQKLNIIESKLSKMTIVAEKGWLKSTIQRLIEKAS